MRGPSQEKQKSGIIKIPTSDFDDTSHEHQDR